MATPPLSKVVEYLRRAAYIQEGPRLTDEQLLSAFLDRREDAAFEAMVRRHGAMVFGVCRRILHDRHDAEDAFQATFMVFIRKSAGIGNPERLAQWLYGVANRSAWQARKKAARRRAGERQVWDMAQRQSPSDEAIQELLPFLDEELSRLPDKYKVPIILCDLEGRTRKEAAKQLKIPEGTLSTRLMRGREMLAKRLARHGTALSAGALALALTQSLANAAVPPSLVASTVKAGLLLAAGKTTATGVLSVTVAALTEKVVKTMFLSKLKMVAVLLLAGTFVGGGGLVAYRTVEAQGIQNGNRGGLQAGPKEVVAVTQDEVKQDAKKAPQVQQNKPPKFFTNGIGMKFAWIPPGSFMMGSPEEEKERQVSESWHKVTLTKGFYVGVYAVTQEQWQAVMGNNPSQFKGEKNLPVETVSWDDCQAFIKKLGEKDKMEYRLPTEAEWEYSCRAGTTTPFYFGETISTDQANYNGNYPYGNGKQGKFREKTTPVGSFPANAFGLYDMHGNVWQWCQDRYGEYPQKDVIDPQGPDAGQSRVLRGASWFDNAKNLRSAARATTDKPTHRYNFNGFRVVRTFTANEAKQGTPPAKDTKEDQKPADGAKEKQPDEPKNKKQTKTENRIGKVILLEVDLAKGIIKACNYGPGGSYFSLSLNPATQITIDGKAATPAELKAIDLFSMATAECEVEVDEPIDLPGKEYMEALNWSMGLIWNKTFEGVVKAIRIDVKGDQKEGVIQSIDFPKNSITMVTRDFDKAKGTTLQSSYDVAKNAKVAINGKQARFDDLKPNMQISLQLSGIKNQPAFEITALGPQVRGLIKSIDTKKNSISVRLIDAQMTAEAAPVAKDAIIVIDGKESKLSDLKAGTPVILQMSAEREQSLVVGITAEKAEKK
jgi:formylglycine-generating enzyme